MRYMVLLKEIKELIFYDVHGSPNPKATGTGKLWKSQGVTSTALGPTSDLGKQS